MTLPYKRIKQISRKLKCTPEQARYIVKMVVDDWADIVFFNYLYTEDLQHISVEAARYTVTGVVNRTTMAGEETDYMSTERSHHG